MVPTYIGLYGKPPNRTYFILYRNWALSVVSFVLCTFVLMLFFRGSHNDDLTIEATTSVHRWMVMKRKLFEKKKADAIGNKIFITKRTHRTRGTDTGI
jgi:hypothetical protein